MLSKGRSYLSISSSYATAALILILLSSVFSTSIVYAQIVPNTQNTTTSTTSTTSTTPSPSSMSQQPPKLHLVKINSPTKGQQVPVGNDLVISGASADNLTSDCKVSVIVNGIKPYQAAFPNGQNGQNDYSV
jgi:hypothetical protein